MTTLGSSLMPSLVKTSPFFSYFTKIPWIFPSQNTLRASLQTYSCQSIVFSKNILKYSCNSYFSRHTVGYLCTVSLAATSSVHESSASSSNKVSNRLRKKALKESPERVLRHKLDMCSKNGQVVEALKLYDEARNNGIQLQQHHYNVLLYLCSSSSLLETSGAIDVLSMGLNRGFEIFQQMMTDNVSPNEATFTSVARIAAVRDDPEMAFSLVKQMKDYHIAPRLRSYGPALFGFCRKLMAKEAYEVDSHMVASAVEAEELELSALLKLSSDVKKVDKVYELLHRLRRTVRQISEPTAKVIEDWFNSESASKVGKKRWDVDKVREGIVRRGGGWHGEGWLGSGKWRLVRTGMDDNGVCHSCAQKLVCIDIDPKETEDFAASLTKLACQREVKADFNKFQEWLEKHGPFDAVIDGANVGLLSQHFSFIQLKRVVYLMRQLSPTKRMPLIILHRSRVTGGPAQNPNNKKLIETWKNCGALYTTPPGSNDDWYWLYAAVRSKCLLLTNDEMRDHLFQLLGNSFFPQWKEKHQVRLSVSTDGLKLHMPPPYSIIIQESENGSWHIPTTTGDDLETPRQWLCATRATDTS
ncbi:proteinaceous RNase P 1, chloroplastic/mitochondrial-like [Benincasa hispida]|uniref:proteinaceous RNase P 1, chloroplastic/mitochondrial-like n=1 Tax=Benincasa hispida TaxID=102211 RepID=UPI001900DFDA|nr:proteinaceous RNase P 1, chloroplastic/mitochondrial-like [Benincasa hispida]XP_038878403.1 proteinaceous RNase P 1, chloroplastic/mitochondrial-like [Benincasa hispida]